MLRFSTIAVALMSLFAPITVSAQSAEELALVKGIFAQLNPRSIAENKEFCGYIGLDGAGNLAFSQPTPGNSDSCLADDPTNIDVITTSYHTHAAFSPDYSSELPSGADMEGDEDEGIDGWVATPGGRLWYIDTEDMITRQICGIGCVPSDPDFVAGDSGIIEQSYSYDELIIKLDE
ncbi:MAG: DUF4329 domain-containing protein [Octadecabacter sp.]|nr:DUF4329 domain-containing protein [Octadecabacter sp.]